MLQICVSSLQPKGIWWWSATASSRRDRQVRERVGRDDIYNYISLLVAILAAVAITVVVVVVIVVVVVVVVVVAVAGVATAVAVAPIVDFVCF